MEMLASAMELGHLTSLESFRLVCQDSYYGSTSSKSVRLLVEAFAGGASPKLTGLDLASSGLDSDAYLALANILVGRAAGCEPIKRLVLGPQVAAQQGLNKILEACTSLEELNLCAVPLGQAALHEVGIWMKSNQCLRLRKLWLKGENGSPQVGYVVLSVGRWVAAKTWGPLCV